MKQPFKHLFVLLCLVLSCTFTVAAKVNPLKYDIESAGSGLQGTYLVKVYVYKTSAKDAELKFAAIHGVLFRGFSGTPSAPAMAGSPMAEEQHEDFFEKFFKKEKTYVHYAEVLPGSYERVKMAKGGYKIGAIVQVSKDMLRNDLVQAGVIQGLNNGF